MIDAPLALAFTAGMIATVNPCGFAMLPAYLSFFIGTEADSTSRDVPNAVGRALVVGLAVSAGFALTFGVIGLVVSHLTNNVYDFAPWLSVFIGVVLMIGGIALLRGADLSVALPKLERGGRTRGLGSMFVFGVSYAVASLGCTLPLFVASVAGTFQEANLVSGLAYFVAYAVGMAVVLVSLTVTLSLTRQSLLRLLRRALPHINRIAGVLLVLMGAYVAYYGMYEIRFEPGASGGDSVVERVTGWSSDVSSWVQDQGGTRIGLVLALVVAAGGVIAATRTSTRARR